jgi:hypothetical protein
LKPLKTFFLDLAFRADDDALAASAAIRVKNLSSSGRLYDRPNLKLVSHECMTFRQLEAAIDKLHRELESVKREGRRRFRASERAQRWRQNRN